MVNDYCRGSGERAATADGLARVMSSQPSEPLARPRAPEPGCATRCEHQRLVPQHPRLELLAVPALARGPSLSALSAAAGARLSRLRQAWQRLTRVRPCCSAGNRASRLARRWLARWRLPGGDEVAAAHEHERAARRRRGRSTAAMIAIVVKRFGEAHAVGVLEGRARRRGAGSRRSWLTSPDSSSVAELAVGRADDLGAPARWRRSAAVVPWVTLCWKTAPRPAIPVAIPTWRKVELIPEAIPQRSCGTTPIAVEASGGLTRPMPAPASTKPGISTVQVEEASTVVIASRPMPDSSRPEPSSRRTGTRTLSLPAIGATMNDSRVVGQEAQPGLAAGCSRARPGCRG